MSFKAPVTSEIQDLFARYGVDPHKHEKLVIALMNLVYDQRRDAQDVREPEQEDDAA